MTKIFIKEILNFCKREEIQYNFRGNEESFIEGYAPLTAIKNNAMLWARDSSYIDRNALKQYDNILLFVGNGTGKDFNCNIIETENPHKSYFKVLNHFWCDEDYDNKQLGIAKTAIVKTQNIGINVSIGEGSFIDKDVMIGDNVTIQHNVTVQGCVEIGSDSFIQSGTTIGVTGFGHYIEDGIYIAVPHLGGVKIGRNVRIGSAVCICRGCLSDTIIEDNVRIDNLCHVAHNDVIKKNSMVVAGSMIGGSTTIGADTWIGLGTLIKDGTVIGERAYCGAGAVIVKDVPEEKVVVGVPAKVIRSRNMKTDID